MAARYGSDLIVDLLKLLDIEYVSLNPGSSFRGIHDSLVNYESGRKPNPEMILCCHEEIAVAVAHGYAKATGKIMPAIVHNVVGLQHASMAIYNAWCDRTPVMVMGGTGPMNSSNRRPWIDWIHTVSDQGALIRDYTKWDNQPASVPSAYEALVRDQVKFRVGQIVYAAFSRDETIMGFGFPKEEREALVASEPDKFLMPGPSDMRYRWVQVRLAAIDGD